MDRHWRYWRLMDERSRVVGFMRRAGGKCEYADMRWSCWSDMAIEHADTVEIHDAPEGLRYLKVAR